MPLTDAPTTEEPQEEYNAADDISEMNKAFGYEDEPKTEPPTTEEPDDSEEPEDEEEPDDGEAETDPPTTDAPSELEELRAEIERLKAEQSPKTDAPGTDPPATQAPLEDQDFLGDDDLDDIMEDPERFNAMLNRVYKKGVEDGRTPALDAKQVAEEVEVAREAKERMQKLHDEFYETNEDLVPWKSAVGVVFGELQAANPDQDFAETLEAVATETRKRLGLGKTKAKQKPGGNPPPLPKGKRRGARPSSQKQSNSLADEIGEMNTTLRR